MLSLDFRYRFFIRITAIYFAVQLLVRIFFLWLNPIGFLDSIDALLDGFLWDSVAWMILALPAFMYSNIFKQDFYNRKIVLVLESLLLFLLSFCLVFIASSELFFWNEFHSRFNFIAVDYLIYTNEVLANLRESFNLFALGVSDFTVAVALTIGSCFFIKFQNSSELSRVKRYSPALFFIVPSLVLSFSPWLNFHDQDFRDDQIGKNGIVEFISAFRANKIVYKDFYKVLPQNEIDRIHKNIVTRGNSSVSLSSRPNVVIIIVESLGAKFIKGLGGKESVTPFLNQLAEKSLFFENFYATGTRTVRGLEAISLSIPPTPGASIVKRPDHKNLFSMGEVFKRNGYEPSFFYGGYGYFDNMNSFFANNGFTVIDKLDFKDDEITFTNAWGTCDQDLFNKELQYAREAYKRNSPFLHVLLTTSNHRPFTYPEGKIDIPSGIGREGAVKYTDFSIGEYIRKAESEGWSKNTLFVIVADHSTEGRGQFELELDDYHIPLWIYAPNLLKPAKIKKLSGQIDLLPTLISTLNLKDNSPLFGKNIFDENYEGEAFIGNYQHIGYLKENVLTGLGPNKTVRSYQVRPASKEQTLMSENPFEGQTVYYYQYASWMLENGKYTASSR